MEDTVQMLRQNHTCEICIESVISSSTNKSNYNKSCAHQICKDCMIKYIQVKVDDNTADVPCPGLNCKRMLDPLSCRAILPPKLFEKWCNVLCNSAVLGFERCYCPNRDCSALILNECGGNAKKTVCPNCNKLFCFECKIPWHWGHRCEESGQIIDENDVMFGVLIETEKLKRCPSCGMCIQLIKGCNHVKCRCGMKFCYKCGSMNMVCKCDIDVFGYLYIIALIFFCAIYYVIGFFV